MSSIRSNSVVEVNAYGRNRKVYVGERRGDGSYSARLRDSYTGNSVRGILRQTKVGLRFKATNPEYVY